MTRFTILLAGIVAAALSCASLAQAPRKLQDVFNEAQAAYDAEDWPKAIAGFEELVRRAKPGTAQVAIFRSRLARGLADVGKREQAMEEAQAALALFDRLKIVKSEDRADALITIGDRHRGDLEFAPSIAAYRNAIAAADGPNTAALVNRARFGLAYAALTVDPDLAAQTLGEIATDLPPTTETTKGQRNHFDSLRALAELNRGDAKAAARYVAGFTGQGAMSTRVKLDDVRTRGNAALVYARLNDQDKVRLLLAYSGAGTVAGSAQLAPDDADLPVCGEEVLPTDYAVVEFAISDAGRTIGVAPLYASRPGTVGAAFAESVKTWRWNPGDLAKLSLFWRASVRMELRCTKRPSPTTLATPFRDATNAWFVTQGVRFGQVDAAAGTAPLPPVTKVGTAAQNMFKAKPGREKTAATAELRRLVAEAQAPIEVQAYLAYGAALPGATTTRRSYYTQRSVSLTPAVDAFSGRPGAEHATAWLRTERAIDLEALGNLDQAHAELDKVVKLPIGELPADDPIRNVATIHLSMIERRAGKGAVADQRLADSGIGAAQCSMLDVRPIQQAGDLGSSDFPTAALRWGFEGYVREAFDIDAQGRVQDVRTVIAYPPFVFGPSTERAFARFRYTTPVMDGQPIGCVEQIQKVRYQIPGR